MPHTEHNDRKVNDYKLEIQHILEILATLELSLDENLGVDEHAAHTVPVGFGGTATTSVPESSGMSLSLPLHTLYRKLTVTWLINSITFTPACGCLIRRTFSPYELSSMIEIVLSSKDEGDIVHRLCGDDAQAFIDVIDEVCSVTPHHHRTKSIEMWIGTLSHCQLGTR